MYAIYTTFTLPVHGSYLLGMNSRNSCMVDGLDGSMAAPKNSMMFGGAFLMRQANFRQM